MTNLEALDSACTFLCSTFYPDSKVLNYALFQEGITPDKDATPKDKKLSEVAIKLVMGYVETSRSEGGSSSSVDRDAVENNIKRMCNDLGLDASEFIEVSSITDASDLW